MAVQACHVSVAAVLCAEADALKNWEVDGQIKVALGVNSLAELESLKRQCEAMGIVPARIADAGRTTNLIEEIESLINSQPPEQG